VNNSQSELDQAVQAAASRFAAHVPYARDIGLAMDEVGPDRIRMHIPPNPILASDPSNQFFFPGVLFSLADSACGVAVFRARGQFVPLATLDMRIDHLAPATMDADLIADASCYRITKDVAFTRCEVRCGKDERVVAVVVGTFMLATNPYKPEDIRKMMMGDEGA
jgi:uncharacterized protein (TIGR00369 family)